MHCPVCGQQQISSETRFCSRCGFPLSGVAELIANGGALTETSSNTKSPRKRGLMQGLFIFLLTFLVVPIIAMLTVAVRAEPFAVAIAAVLLTVGGLLRMAYALMFESSVAEGGPPDEKQLKEPKNTRLRKATHGELPPQQIVPASSYVSPTPGSWRDTNDLVSREPGSITEGTTKLLQNEDEP